MGKQCDEESDYDHWFAHEDIKIKDNAEKGCQLGQRNYYQKLKKDVVCYQGKRFDIHRISRIIPRFLAQFFRFSDMLLNF